MLLGEPLDKFGFEPPLTHLTWDEWEHDRDNCLVMFFAGEKMMTGGGTMTWMLVKAEKNEADSADGYVLVPLRYYGLWRRLLWGGRWYEGMWQVWEEDAKDITARDASTHTPVEKWILFARRSAAIKAVWYTVFRRVVLDELMKIEIDEWLDDDHENNPVLWTLIEFGIRDYRSWLFDSFEDVKKTRECKYLKLDPSAPENEEEFCRFLL